MAERGCAMSSEVQVSDFGDYGQMATGFGVLLLRQKSPENVSEAARKSRACCLTSHGSHMIDASFVSVAGHFVGTLLKRNVGPPSANQQLALAFRPFPPFLNGGEKICWRRRPNSVSTSLLHLFPFAHCQQLYVDDCPLRHSSLPRSFSCSLALSRWPQAVGILEHQ
jgi:hypothetical protein